MLDGRITVGGPLAVPVTPDYVANDAALRAFVAQEATSVTYHLVHLSLSLRNESGTPPLETVDLELTLSSPSLPEPQAWSMMPKQIIDESQVTTNVQLDPQLHLFGVGGSLGSAGQSTVEQAHEVFLEALNELGGNPAWHFKRTRRMDLRGCHRLIMVLRAPRHATTDVYIVVRASVEIGRRGLRRRYYAELPNPLVVVATI